MRGAWSEGWRYAFLGGLGAGALASAALYPEGFFQFPETYSLARAAVGGEGRQRCGARRSSTNRRLHALEAPLPLGDGGCQPAQFPCPGNVLLHSFLNCSPCSLHRPAGWCGHQPGQWLHQRARRVRHCAPGTPLPGCHRHAVCWIGVAFGEPLLDVTARPAAEVFFATAAWVQGCLLIFAEQWDVL